MVGGRGGRLDEKRVTVFKTPYLTAVHLPAHSSPVAQGVPSDKEVEDLAADGGGNNNVTMDDIEQQQRQQQEHVVGGGDSGVDEQDGH